MAFKELIRSKRPHLADSSVNTYNSILTSLAKKVFGDALNEPGGMGAETFGDTKRVIAFLSSVPPGRRKTILSALVVASDEPASRVYREQMLRDVEAYDKTIAEQEKTPTQAKNWVHGPEIEVLWEKLRRNAAALYKKEVLHMLDYQEIQDFVILSLYGGHYIAPRRSQDYTHFKIKSVDPGKDNYMTKNELVFNAYKTHRTYGQQRVAIPAELKTILTKWAKTNPTEYLFFDTRRAPLTSVKLNQRLNKLFGKKVGVNALRHTYLTDKYHATIETNRQLKDDMAAMGSSTDMAATYIKK